MGRRLQIRNRLPKMSFPLSYEGAPQRRLYMPEWYVTLVKPKPEEKRAKNNFTWKFVEPHHIAHVFLPSGETFEYPNFLENPKKKKKKKKKKKVLGFDPPA